MFSIYSAGLKDVLQTYGGSVGREPLVYVCWYAFMFEEQNVAMLLT